MLSAKMMPNLLGVTLCGDYDELNRLYDAVWTLVNAERDFDD